MQAPRQGQVRRSGGMLQRRVVLVGGDHIPQWNSSSRNLERSSSDDLDLPGSGDMCGDLQGPPIVALTSDDLDSLSTVPYPSSGGPSGAFEQAANGNPFVNGMNHKLFNSIPREIR
ncbi:uncharacterized protein [Setaria viridis]